MKITYTNVCLMFCISSCLKELSVSIGEVENNDDVIDSISTNSAVLRLENAMLKTIDNSENTNSDLIDTENAKFDYKRGSVKELNELVNYSNEDGKILLLHFHADWCFYSQNFVNVMNSMHTKLRGLMYFLRIDTVSDRELASQYKIRSFPTIVLLQNGEELFRLSGYRDENEQLKLLKTFLTDTNPDVDIEQVIALNEAQHQIKMKEIEEFQLKNADKYGIREGNREEFNKIKAEAQNERKPIIIDFYATWCGPCKSFRHVFDNLNKKYNGQLYFYKVDVDVQGDIASEYGITAIPTIVIINSEGILYSHAGVPRPDELKAQIERAIKVTE